MLKTTANKKIVIDDTNPAVHAVANNDFAYRLLSQLPKKGNLFYSPFNIRAALAMVYAGAREKTADEMMKTCGFAKDQKVFHLVMSQIKEALEKTGVLRLANNVWVSDEQKVELLFKKVLEEMYKAPFKTVDFKNSYNEIRLEINKWVEEKTMDRIQNLLGPNTLNGGTQMVLVSAIYFKDDWNRAFEKDGTTNEPFWTAGANVTVRMMNQKGNFGYGETETYKILEMPYKSGLSFVAILPQSNDDLPRLEKEISSPKFVFAELRTQEVRVSIPRFKLEYGFSVKEMLVALGMPLAFSDKADFSGISKGEDALKISDVVHKAFCEVNEEGTEAAAATAVVMMKLASFRAEPQPKIFRADHPFLFMIRENSTGHILFMGRVEDPR
jgi:serpin B